MFAEKTKVPADKSAGEIRKALLTFGGKDFALATHSDKAHIAFTYKEMRVKIVFSTPTNPGESATLAQKKKHEQAINTRWRQLLLCVKAKLESINCGIETFEQAFMAHIETTGI